MREPLESALDDIPAQHGTLNIWMDLDKRIMEIYYNILGYAPASNEQNQTMDRSSLETEQTEQ